MHIYYINIKQFFPRVCFSNSIYKNINLHKYSQFIYNSVDDFLICVVNFSMQLCVLIYNMDELQS